MRYLGNKSRISQNIIDLALELSPTCRVIADPFGGSGAAARALKATGAAIYTNDLLSSSYFLLTAGVCANVVPRFKRFKTRYGNDPFTWLSTPSSDLASFAKLRTVVQERYSQSAGRLYFTDANAILIDGAREAINKFREDGLISKFEHDYLIGCLIAASSKVANTTGTFGAFLKTWEARALKPLTIQPLEFVNNHKKNFAYNLQATEFLRDKHFNVIYIDPPYNARQYLSNYHVLEAIACKQVPQSKGVSGAFLDATKKSAFCSKRTVRAAFEELFSVCDSDSLIVSYSSESLLPESELENLIKSWGKPSTFNIERIKFQRYQNIKAREQTVFELLLSIRRS